MQVTPQKPSATPALRAWEVSGMGLPRAYISAYGQQQAKSEYRIRYQLHSSRPVEAVEVKDVGRITA